MTPLLSPTHPEIERSKLRIVLSVIAHSIGMVMIGSDVLVSLVLGEASIPNAATGVPLVMRTPLALGLYDTGMLLTAVFSALSIYIYLHGKKPSGGLWWARAGVFVLALVTTIAGVLLALPSGR